MSFQTYISGIPAANNNPSNDQPNMLTNTNSIPVIIATDHHGFNDNLGGYHTIIHQDTQGTWNPVTQTGAPAAIASINQIVALSYTPDTTGGTADTQLFNVTGKGGISQLTGYSTGVSTDGWQWIGGILIQWGKVTLPGSSNPSGTVTFKDRVVGAIPFPRNCFNISATLIGSSSTSNTISIKTGASKTQFEWTFTGSTSYTAFYWTAIGN